MRKTLLYALVICLISVTATAAKIKTGEDVIKAMHEKYAGKWYKTLTFVQENTQATPNNTDEHSKWYEALSLPGKLRIDFDPLDSGDGALFLDGKQMSFKGGKLDRTVPRTHVLMVIGFDVYFQPVEKTVSQLKALKYDTDVLSENEWQGRPVWVIGAKKGDDKTSQIWIDKTRLLFVRLVTMGGKDGSQLQETRFNKYFEVKGGGWVSPEVEFIVNGKRVFLEEYTEIQTGVPLNEDLFVPEKWASVEKNYFKASGKQ